MSAYAIGQRFVSEAEPELGLGRVEHIEKRSLVVRFPASDTVRKYAIAGAPIRRVLFRVGDEVEDERGRRIRVQRVIERDGLRIYVDGALRISESELSGRLTFSRPDQRLLAGLWDRSRGFDIRRRALVHRHALLKSEARGFIGGRIQLIPHQLGIAREVASRLRPRALLADEVGLGKTIEAGLILHRLLRSGRATRALILVPEPLVNQWFVEMFRRFHLSFAIIDEDSCRDAEAAGEKNPFLLAQTAIAAVSFVAGDEKRCAQAEAAGWDLLVVDEAHHLRPPAPEYRLVEALAARTAGVLLLTATPEQLGEESHFERLRLLDPERYASYERYQENRGRYRAVARIASRIVDGRKLEPKDLKELSTILPRSAKTLRQLLKRLSSGEESARAPLVQALVDQHGPGRVVFRNSRSVLARFPPRKLHPAPLEWPKDRMALQSAQLAEEFLSDSGHQPLPEYPYFFDARVSWLSELLREAAPRKVLVICRYKEKALALHEALRRTSSIPIALFHEGLSLLSRDRNAAWFAAERDGAQALLASEIGSEGRNFQFAHHLVLFDLPVGGELLEQRIGRLHRIGQEHEVSIHVPYLPGSPQEMLFRFHHEGLDAFENSLPGAPAFEELSSRLLALAGSHREGRTDQLEPFLEETRSVKSRVLSELAAGRDRLLELGSFRRESAELLAAEIRRWDEDPALESFAADALDYLGVDLERISPRTFVFRQGSKLEISSLPGLRAQEVGMTADRDRATREGELDFLTWDHPMMIGVLDLVLGGPMGSASVALLSRSGSEPSIVLETMFVLEAVAPPELDVPRFLPPTPIRMVVDRNRADVTAKFPVSALEGRLMEGRKEPGLREAAALQERVPGMVAAARALAEAEMGGRIETVLAEMRTLLSAEIARLASLAEVNDHLDRREVAGAKARLAKTAEAIRKAKLRLDSLRLIWLGVEPSGG